MDRYCRQESTLGTDLVHDRPWCADNRLPRMQGVLGIQVQVIEAGLGAVQHAEPDPLGPHTDHRVDPAINQDRVKEGLGHDRGRSGKRVERGPGKHGRRARAWAVVPTSFRVERTNGVGSRTSRLVRFIDVRVPKIALLPPLPSRVLGEDVTGNEGFVLDYQWDVEGGGESRKQARGDQPALEIVRNYEPRGDTGIGVGAGDPYGVVVVPDKPGALIHWVIIGRCAPWRARARHVHEASARQPIRSEPLKRSAITE